MLCLALLLYGLAGYSQELEIHGIIEDEHGQVLENIIIKLVDQERFTSTDQNGQFVILAKEGSKASLSHLAYRPQTVVLSNHMHIVMQEQAFDLDNIIVTADPLGNLAQSRIVYDDVKAVTQPRNVSDLFKDIPGFGIQKRGAYASEPVFRAFKYEQLNVQYDGGMKILNACPNRMDPITTHVIPEEIEKIEIVKGPFTVRFGQNFGGIINMVSKTPESKEDGISGNVETGYHPIPVS